MCSTTLPCRSSAPFVMTSMSIPQDRGSLSSQKGTSARGGSTLIIFELILCKMWVNVGTPYCFYCNTGHYYWASWVSLHSILADSYDHKFYKQDQRGCWATLNSHHAYMVMCNFAVFSSGVQWMSTCLQSRVAKVFSLSCRLGGARLRCWGVRTGHPLVRRRRFCGYGWGKVEPALSCRIGNTYFVLKIIITLHESLYLKGPMTCHQVW